MTNKRYIILYYILLLYYSIYRNNSLERETEGNIIHFVCHYYYSFQLYRKVGGQRGNLGEDEGVQLRKKGRGRGR